VSKVVLKDKKDMNELFQFEGYENWDEITDNGLEWEDYKIMGSQDEIKRNLETEVLSVKFSKIGQKTFEAYPNLKWIQCRAHGSDNINLELAENRRVGVVCLDPDTYNVANWIGRFKMGKNILLLGAGKIGDAIPFVWESDVTKITSKSEIPDMKNFNRIINFDTIIVTSSPTEKPILNKELLENFRGNIISISRPACIDNEALLEAVNDGRVENAQMDMLDPKGRDELIATGKVKYHGHKAWQANGVTQYDERYFIMVFQEIQWLLRNDPQYDPPVRNSRVVLERKPNSLFGD
jgi:phosphoglycerate dehydrogenase-like enzyme